NGKIFERTGFKEVFVQPAAGDNGTAIGAAAYVEHEILRRPRRFVMRHAYTGPAFDDAQISSAIEAARANGWDPAISVKRLEAADIFERGEPSPFMLMVYKVKESQRARIPCVTHVDNTGRLQTVSASTNPRYHALISEFERQTGVPLVLNTSFNEHEPIVTTPT